MKHTAEHNNRIELYFAFAILVALIAVAFAVQPSHGQQPPPVPSFAQPQQQLQGQLYVVPGPVLCPFIRYRVLGRPVPFVAYQPIGQPFPATVQPVVPYGGVR